MDNLIVEIGREIVLQLQEINKHLKAIAEHTAPDED